MVRAAIALLFAALAFAQEPKRILYVTHSAGYRHDSIIVSRDVLHTLNPRLQFTPTEDLSQISADNLRNYDAVFFFTSGELDLRPEQKTALLDFVRRGGGFGGVHSATDTLYQWPEYGALVGAYFKEHPWTQTASVHVEAPGHPATQGLGASFSILEEFYTFQENPRPRVQVLLALDAASVGAAGDFPLAWTQSVGAGRSYYNALGHFPSTWADPRFQSQLMGAIRWVARRE